MSKKEVAFSIVSFLKSEVKSENQNADDIGGLKVAIDVIESVFGLKQFKPEHETSLLNIFNSASKKDSSRLLRNKLVADDYKNKGNKFMKTKLYDEAIDSYTKAIELDSKNAVYYCNRAAAWIKLQNNQRAISDCKCAINIDPTYCKAYGRLGLVYKGEEQLDKAVASYEKAVSLEPNNYAYKSNLELLRHILSEANSKQPPTPNPENLPAGLNFSDLSIIPVFKNGDLRFMKSPPGTNMFFNLFSATSISDTQQNFWEILESYLKGIIQLYLQKPETMLSLMQCPSLLKSYAEFLSNFITSFLALDPQTVQTSLTTLSTQQNTFFAKGDQCLEEKSQAVKFSEDLLAEFRASVSAMNPPTVQTAPTTLVTQNPFLAEEIPRFMENSRALNLAEDLFAGVTASSSATIPRTVQTASTALSTQQNTFYSQLSTNVIIPPDLD